MSQVVKWGILSTANIALKKVIPAMQNSKQCEIVAIASRNMDDAQSAAKALGIPNVYGSYESLLADPEIEAVYIPLPNHLHVQWTVNALQAGKHVLCEKPIALNAQEAQQLLDATRAYPRLKVMEAFMYRFHPQWQRAKQLVDNGEIGELRSIQSAFSYFNDDPANIRNKPEMGGGGLMDIGCYCISLSRFIFGAEPVQVLGKIDYDPKLQIDRFASGMLEFEQGHASFICSTQFAPFQRVNIFGSKGRIEIEIPFNAPPDRPCRLLHQRGEHVEEIVIDVCDQYTIQGDLFSDAILNDTDVPTQLEDAVNNMKIIDALFQSDKEGSWISQ